MSNSVSTSTSSNSGTLSGAIKFTGLGSGSDFDKVVEQLIDIEKRVITRQETWKSQWQAKLTSITTLDTKMVSLKLNAQEFDTRSELLTRSSNSSKPEVITLTNTSTAPEGTYNIKVGSNIVEKMASRSFKKGDAIGGTGPLSFTIGNKTLTLDPKSNPDWTDPADAFTYDPDGDLEKLAEAINTFTVNGLVTGLTAEVIYDKTRSDGVYQRLVITGVEGGRANHISVTDGTTNLKLGENFTDEPVNATLMASSARPKIGATSSYTGDVNKTFNFMINKGGTLGVDDVDITWADTEGHSGNFIIKADEWNADNNKEYEIYQGLKMSFDPGMFRKSEAFTVDCQSPVMQKAADSGIAQTDRWTHAGFSDLISPISPDNSGQFIFEYGGKKCSVAVGTKDSLGILVSKINDAPDNPGVIASIVNDGMGTATSYKLVLTGKHTGADNTIKIIEPAPGRTLSNLPMGEAFLTHTREASNSMFKVDGFPDDPSAWVQRRTVDINDVIDGANFSLHGTGESTITIKNDVNAMAGKITQFVGSVNFVKTYIQEQTKWGESKLEINVAKDGTISRKEETPSGVMIGNYGFQISQTQIDGVMATNLFPLKTNAGSNRYKGDLKAQMEAREQEIRDNKMTYMGVDKDNKPQEFFITCLADIGITSDPKNKALYTVDQKKLTEVLTKNPEAVMRLMCKDGNEEFKIDPEDTLKRTDIVTTRGICDYMAKVTNLLTSSEDIIDKKTGEIIKPNKGITKVLIGNYNNIIKGINDKIFRETRRIDTVKTRLTKKFARMETALAGLNKQSDRINSAISALPKAGGGK